MKLLMQAVCSPSPMIVGAALSVSLAVLQVSLDIAGVKGDPVISDAFKVASGVTVSLIGARQIAINSRSMNGGTK